jgi:hypothetical protein
MHGIYLTATPTTALALAIFGTLTHKQRQPADERLVWLAAALALPLQPLAFYFVRIPLDHWLVAHLDSTSASYRWLISCYAPLTEEPAKLIPLLIPAIRRDFAQRTLSVTLSRSVSVSFSSSAGAITTARTCEGRVRFAPERPEPKAKAPITKQQTRWADTARVALRVLKTNRRLFRRDARREAHHAATRLEGILQKHDFVRFTAITARGEGDLLCGYLGGAAGADTKGEDDGKKRDG